MYWQILYCCNYRNWSAETEASTNLHYTLIAVNFAKRLGVQRFWFLYNCFGKIQGNLYINLFLHITLEVKFFYHSCFYLRCPCVEAKYPGVLSIWFFFRLKNKMLHAVYTRFVTHGRVRPGSDLSYTMFIIGGRIICVLSQIYFRL